MKLSTAIPGFVVTYIWKLLQTVHWSQSTYFEGFLTCVYLYDVQYVHVEVLHGKGITSRHTQHVVISVLHEKVLLGLVLPLTLHREHRHH